MRRADVVLGVLLVAVGAALLAGGDVIFAPLDIALGALLLLRVHLRIAVRWQRRLIELTGEPTSMTWSSADVVIETPTVTTTYSWARFSGLHEVDGFVLLLIGPPRRGLVSLAVPRRAFTDDRLLGEFLYQASAGVAAARNGDA